MNSSKTEPVADDHGGAHFAQINADESPLGAQNTALSPCPELAQGARILLVEDEETLRLAVAKMLRKRGFIVLTAADGRDAVDLLRRRQDISLLFLDVTIPGLSSHEVLEETRRIRPDIPVILTSAHSQSVVNSSFAGMPIKHFVRKPYRLAALVNLFESVLSTP